MQHINSVYQSAWWLDAVAPGDWKEAIATRGDPPEIVGRMPYVLTRSRYGTNRILMPPFTRTLGPWLAPVDGKESTKIANDKAVMAQLIEQLPEVDSFSQSFHYSITNWLPFYWAGFQQTTCYTYVVDISDLDATFARFGGAKRGDVRKAAKIVGVEEGAPGPLFEQHKENLEKLGDKIGYRKDALIRLYDAATKQGCGIILQAIDGNRNIHASIFVVWNELSAYFIVSSLNPEFRNSGALSLLMWESMKHCAQYTKRLDFAGGMVPSYEHSYRMFGGQQTPYSLVTKRSKRQTILYGLSEARKLFTR